MIRELARLADAESITYNVHLPSDIYLGHTDPTERRRSAHAVQTVVDRCETLAPSTFTLHLNRNPDLPEARWQEYLTDALKTVLSSGMDSRQISVETLDYPLAQVAPVIAALDLSVCMDMGHLLVHGVDLASFYAAWQQRITIIHLHGVDHARDHLPLDHLSGRQMDKVLEILRDVAGVVSLEVYSQPALNASLAYLTTEWFRPKANGC